MKTVFVLELIVSAVLLAVGLVGYFAFRHADKNDKKAKKKKTLFFVLTLIAGWFMLGTVIQFFSTVKMGLSVEFEMFSARVQLFGFSVAETTLVSWGIIALVTVLCLAFRFLVFPRFDPDHAKGFQNIMELSVEATESFTKGVLGDYGSRVAPYMYSLAAFMVFSAFSELLGFRPPTSDLTVTFAMGLITFFLINYYGIRKKGVGGRLKGMMTPTPIILPMKILSDIATPVSLACRLFGNMLGGMIVMHLLKSVLGGYAVGIPAVAGLYFNLFHPIIQTYIFMILSLTFISEAIE